MRYAAALVVALVGCAGLDTVTGTTLYVGTYTATAFGITPAGQSAIDVLAAGGSLSITITKNGSTTGLLNLPSSVTGGAPVMASMAGTAEITGLTVQFQQTADTFVRDLVWSRIEGVLMVAELSVGGATYNIALVRQ
ncbi:MAG TPA: hypothetical protein VJK71_05640 [Gemmatimonadales bacterium]|nr:hypothetical protein [Gemmatimonadales bacterium]